MFPSFTLTGNLTGVLPLQWELFLFPVILPTNLPASIMTLPPSFRLLQNLPEVNSNPVIYTPDPMSTSFPLGVPSINYLLLAFSVSVSLDNTEYPILDATSVLPPGYILS